MTRTTSKTARKVQYIAKVVDAFRQQAAQAGIKEVSVETWEAIAQRKALAQFSQPNAALKALWIEE